MKDDAAGTQIGEGFAGTGAEVQITDDVGTWAHGIAPGRMVRSGGAYSA